MPTFNPDEYFSSKLNSLSSADMLANLAQVSAEKVAALQQYSTVAQQRQQQQAAEKEATATSWVSQLGLDPEGVVGGAVNIAANAYSGTSRIIGEYAALPFATRAITNESGLYEPDFQAYNRYSQGTATADDLERLHTDSGAGSVLERVKQAGVSRNISLRLDEAFDRSSAIHSTKKTQLGHELEEGFTPAWEQTKGGVAKLKNGEVLDGAGDVASGIAKLVFNAGEAAFNNKQASAEYIAENLPQLLIGGVKYVGGKLLLASNVGYASDYYQKGIEKFQAENGGAYPPEATRKEMAIYAVSTAAVEHASDKVALAVGKIGTKAATDTTADAVKIGFKQSLKNTFKAAGAGLGTESPTEGWQTFAEGKASLTPASAKEIYVGGAIGGITGAGMTGGARAVAEFSKATPEHVAERAQTATEATQFQDAVKANDVTPYMDPKTAQYSPTKAVGVLLHNAQLEDTTPETKTANLKQAGDIVSSLEEQQTVLQERIDSQSVESVQGIKDKIAGIQGILASTTDEDRVTALNSIITSLNKDLLASTDKKIGMVAATELSKLERHLKASRSLMEGMVNTVQPAMTDVEVKSNVTLADSTPVEVDTAEVNTARQTATESIINLSMRSTTALSAVEATQLADNLSNTLTEADRTHLRAFSAARIAENSLSSITKVQQDVLNGSQKSSVKQMGIVDWRARMTSAIAAGNQKSADRALAGLTKFSEDHAAKQVAMAAALKAGDGTQIQRNKTNGTWFVATPTQNLSKGALEKNGGLSVHSVESKHIIAAIPLEVAALAKAVVEMQSTHAIKFGGLGQQGIQSLQSKKRSLPQRARASDLLATQANPLIAGPTASPDIKGNVASAKSVPGVKDTTKTNPTEAKTEATKLAHQAEIARRKAVKSAEANPTPETTSETKNIWFGSNENASLSNLASRPFIVANHKFKSVEHAYQSLKSGKLDTVTDAAYNAAKTGVKIVGKLKANTATNIGLMEKLILRSFQQNPEATKALLATGTSVLTHTQDNGVWKTEFPRILMAVRENLAEQAKPAVTPKPETKEAKQETSKQQGGAPATTQVAVDVTAKADVGNTKPETKTTSLVAKLMATEDSAAEIDAWQLVEISKDPEEKAHAEKLLANEKQAYDALHAETSRIITRMQAFGTTAAITLKERLDGLEEIKTDTANSDLIALYEAAKVYAKEVSQKQPSLFDSGLTSSSSPAASMSSLSASANVSPPLAALVAVSTSPASSPDASAAETPTTETVPEVVSKYGILGLFAQRTAKGIKQAYKARHLIADYFKQDAGKKEDGTLRPLASMKDFLTKVKEDSTLIESFLKGKLTDEQHAVVSAFLASATTWQSKIEGSLIRIQDKNADPINYRYTDLAQFFIHEEGKVDMDENVKTAISYAAFAAMIDLYSTGRLASPKDINGFLGNQDGAYLPDEAYNLLADKGTLEGVLKNSWGQTVIASLGLKPEPNAPKNLLPTLEAAMGAQVLKLLLELGVIENTQVTKAQIDPFSSKNKSKNKDKRTIKSLVDKAKKTGVNLTSEELAYIAREQSTEIKNGLIIIKFVRLVRDVKYAPDASVKYAEYSVHSLVQKIFDTNKGTQSILSKLFSVESNFREPTLVPVPYVQPKAGDGRMDNPSKLVTILEEENKSEHFLRTDLWNYVLGQVTPEIAMDMAGHESVVESKMWKPRRLSVQAKNDGLRREYDRLMEFIHGTLSKSKKDLVEALQQPMHFEHDTWIQQRVGILTNMINPQSSKIHRPMLYRKSWDTVVDINDVDSMDNFRLRVGEGLGIKTDKQGNVKSLVEFAGLFNRSHTDPKKHAKAVALQAAVRVLQKSMQMVGLTPDEQATLAAGVKAGGENFHSLDALMSLAHLAEAVRKEETKFNVQMMAEVDGVTNGPMLSHMLMGAANSVGDLFGLLNRGGFFQQGSAENQYNLWRGVAGHLDLYENTIRNVLDNVHKLIKDKEINETALASIYAFTGMLENQDSSINKAGRNIIKTPLTAIVFSASVASSVDSMADKFVEGIGTAIEDSAAGKEQALTREQLLQNLHQLGIHWKADTSIQEMLDTEFTAGQIKTLKDVFKSTLGKAVEVTIKEDFGAFIEQRDALNRTAQLASAVYVAVYEGMREEMIAELIASGELEFTVIKGKNEPLHDLNAQQEKLLRERVATLEPVMHSAMSKDSGELNAGLFVGKTERKFGDKDTYTNRVHFGTDIQGTTDKSTTVRGYETISAQIGVAMAALSTHSFDSMISHYAAKLLEVLNVHDAHGAGLAIIQQAAKNLNQATWNALLNYSPVAEMHEAYMRTMQGLAQMLEKGDVPDSVISKLAVALIEFAEKTPGKVKPNPQGMVSLLGNISKGMAFKADDMKLQAMALLEAIDQYAMEGGNYLVSDTDRKAAVALRAKLEQYLSTGNQKILGSIDDKLKAAIKAELKKRDGYTAEEDSEMDAPIAVAPKVSMGALGKAIIKSDPKLVAMFAQSAVVDLKQVIAALRGTSLNEFNQRLLRVLEKTLPAGLTVRMITPETQPEDVLSFNKNAHGWFTSKEGKQEIYVLGPEFKASGLTTELLLHEMLHGALAQTIEKELAALQADPNYESETLDIVQELEDLRVRAKAFVKQHRMGNIYDAAMENIHELVSWGMTNKAFQEDVLNKVEVPLSVHTASYNTNSLVLGMKKFISTLTKLMFASIGKGMANAPSIVANNENGMAVLIANTSGLFNAVAQGKPASSTEFTANMTVDPATGLKSFTTMDIYEALEQNNNGAMIDPAFNDHLKGLLSGIVSKLYGPFGSFKAALMEGRNVSPEAVYAEALATGIAPYASESAVAGIAFTDQEAFVFDQVEAVVRAGVETTGGSTFVAYRELDRLYTEVRNKLKVSDFHVANATVYEKAEAQKVYDFIFTIKPGVDGKSDYLSRFAAMGLSHSGFNALLKTATERTNRSTTGLSFNERLNKIVHNILDWFAGKLTNTREGQNADAKLTALVLQLATNEAKRESRVKRQDSTAALITEAADTLMMGKREIVREKLEKFGKLPFFTQNSSGFVRAAGGLASTYGGHRVRFLMEGFAQFRDAHFEGQQGVTAALLNEVRGARATNIVAHFLLRASKLIEGKRKELITGHDKVVIQSFVNKGEDLTDVQLKAITQVGIRTDMQSLMGRYKTMAELTNLVNDRAAVQKEIAKLETELAGLGRIGKLRTFYMNAAETLAYKMATGRVTDDNLLHNAGNIARLYGTANTQRISESEAQAAEAILDPLISLLALSYTKEEHLIALREVMAIEANRTDKGNGVEVVLLTHKALQEQAKELLFSDGKALFMKGYVPEIYDPYMAITVADEMQGKELIKQGYKPGSAVNSDRHDPEAGTAMRMYTLRDGGLPRRVSGIVSLTGMTAKGSRMHNGNVSPLSYTGQLNASNMASIKAKKQAAIAEMFTKRHADPSTVKESFMAPLVNANGEVVNYRYLMEESTKDSLLARDNRPGKLLGSLAGNIYDKVSSKEQNRKAVQALKHQYTMEFAENPNAYLQVGPTSTDPQLREIYRLLPDSTKQAIKEIWGTEGMTVRGDVLDMYFGYRKLSVADMFDKDEAQRSFVEKMLVELGTYAFDQKAPLYVRRAGNVWGEVVKGIKGNLVVRSLSTFTGNLRSNWSQLVLMGISPTDILKHHRVAFKGAWAYKKDSEELFTLQHQLQTDYIAPGNTMAAIKERIQRLEDAIARNPVTPLIDAGLMPTIVEDVDIDDDMYSYKSRFVKQTERLTDKLNPNVTAVGKWLLMTEDTTPYKVMRYGTQIADFLSRYTLYQHAMTRKEKPLNHEEAVQLASDSFINYDVPTHRKVQWLNDSGFWMFTKYYIRIQRIIGRLFKDHPGRVMMMLAAESWLGAQPTVIDSSVLTQWGIPGNSGAFGYFGSLDQIMTVRAAMLPFGGAGGHPGE